MTSRTAIIIGGSMGGLFAGNMLARRGWDVQIFERAEGPLNVRGAGIAGHPELGQILQACGLSRTRINGVDVDGRSAYDRNGNLTHYYPYPQYLTYWGLLHDVLREAFPTERYHAGVGLEALVAREARFSAAMSDGRTLDADLLIAADGVRSQVRQILAPHIRPQYAGYFAFRGLVPERRLSPQFLKDLFARYIWMFCGDGQLNGYPICGPDYATAPGERQYAYLWYRPVDEATMADLLTDASGRRHDASIPPPLIRPEHFAHLKVHARRILPPLFAEIVERADNELLQPMYDVLSERMVFGNVALIGDAAFVARPHVGTGILKAGQDALALADALDADADVPVALRLFERARIPAGRRAVLFSRHLGQFIEQRLPFPDTDPRLGLSPDFLIRSSARSVESVAPDFPVA